MTAISIREARSKPDLVRASIIIDGALIELCEYPEVQEEQLQIVEDQTVLMLGLSPLLSGSEGRIAGDPRRAFVRFGALALRPAGIPIDIHVTQGAFHTLRIRFQDHLVAPVLGDIQFSDALLAACFDMHAPAIEGAMLRLAAEAEHPLSDTIALAGSLVSLILLDLARYLDQATRHAARRGGGLSARSLRLATAMIDAPGPAPSLDALARLCGLSRHHFIRCFQQSVGLNPGAYIRRRTIERAKVMLVSGDSSIEGIARELGYAGSPSFSAAFRRETGQSPRAWRAMML